VRPLHAWPEVRYSGRRRWAAGSAGVHAAVAAGGLATLTGMAAGYEGVKAHLGIKVAENSDEARQISAAAMLTHEPDGTYHSLIFNVRHY
jgi:hypothetical protein